MKRLSASYLTLGYLFFYIPILVLIVYSFNYSEFSLRWHGFSWRWYQALFADSDLLQTAANSLLLGTCAATCATVIGSLAAISLAYYHFRGKQSLFVSLFVLIILPDIIFGAALLILYRVLSIELGFMSLLIAHVTLCIPFVVVVVFGRLSTYDNNIFEAAIDLGASQWQLLANIIVPLISSALVAAWLLSFTLSLDDVLISYFVAGPSFQILPLSIYSMVKLGVNPEVNALTSLILLVTTAAVLLSFVALKKRD